MVDVDAVLIDKHVRRLACLVRQVVCRYLVVVGLQGFKHLGVGEPPFLMRHAAIRIAPYARLHLLADVLGKHRLVDGLQCRVHIVFKHVEACHSGVFLLVGVQRVVELLDVPDVVRYQFLPSVVLLVFVGVVVGVEHLHRLRPVLPCLGVEASDAEVVLMLYGAFLCAVHSLGVLLLRVLRGAKPHEGEHLAGFQHTVLPLAHQVVFHLHLCGAHPAVAVYHTEHIPEHIHHQVGILVPVVGVAHHALARHVVGVVRFGAYLGVFEFARQVAVVE